MYRFHTFCMHVGKLKTSLEILYISIDLPCLTMSQGSGIAVGILSLLFSLPSSVSVLP